jgi:hypothetical protein
MVRVCWFGMLGSGKTLGAVKEAYRYQINHPENYIYSNVPLNPKIFPNYRPLVSAAQLFRISHPCFMLIDEAWHVADSRQPSSVENKALAMMLLRSRKLQWTVAFTQQWYTQLDLRLRFVTDIWIMPQMHTLQDILQEDVYDLHANFLATRFYDARLFYDMYDTTEDPLTLDCEGLEKEYERKHH